MFCLQPQIDPARKKSYFVGKTRVHVVLPSTEPTSHPVAEPEQGLALGWTFGYSGKECTNNAFYTHDGQIVYRWVVCSLCSTFLVNFPKNVGCHWSCVGQGLQDPEALYWPRRGHSLVRRLVETELLFALLTRCTAWLTILAETLWLLVNWIPRAEELYAFYCFIFLHFVPHSLSRAISALHHNLGPRWNDFAEEDHLPRPRCCGCRLSPDGKMYLLGNGDC